MKTIETDRLIIRPIRSEDKTAVFEYRSDSDTNKYQGWIPKDINDVEVFIGNTSGQIDEPGSWFQVVVIEKGSRQIIGDLGLHFLKDQSKQALIGCTLSKAHHGKGYATEAIRAIIDYLFNELNKNLIIASIDPGNTKSIRLFERLGFRKAESSPMNEMWAGDLTYTLIDKDWNERS